MNKSGLIREVASLLKKNDVRKNMPGKKHVFYISDDDGNSRKFSLKQNSKGVLFTAEDVEAIVNATLYVILETLKRGEEVGLLGFGSFRLRHMKAISVYNFENEEEKVEIPERYTPKFVPGVDMKNAAQVYGVSIADMRNITLPLSFVGDDDDDEDEDGDD